MSDRSAVLLAVPGDHNWFIQAETFEPVYNWHLPQEGRPPVPEHVLAHAEKLRKENQ